MGWKLYKIYGKTADEISRLLDNEQRVSGNNTQNQRDNRVSELSRENKSGQLDGFIEVKKGNIYEIKQATITAYSSTEDQTDSTPTITANGKKVYQGLVANNCLPWGTKVEILGNIYTVDDRGHKRHGCNWFDIWYPDKKEAINFGVKRNVDIKIYK